MTDVQTRSNIGSSSALPGKSDVSGSTQGTKTTETFDPFEAPTQLYPFPTSTSSSSSSTKEQGKGDKGTPVASEAQKDKQQGQGEQKDKQQGQQGQGQGQEKDGSSSSSSSLSSSGEERDKDKEAEAWRKEDAKTSAYQKEKESESSQSQGQKGQGQVQGQGAAERQQLETGQTQSQSPGKVQEEGAKQQTQAVERQKEQQGQGQEQGQKSRGQEKSQSNEQTTEERPAATMPQQPSKVPGSQVTASVMSQPKGLTPQDKLMGKPGIALPPQMMQKTNTPLSSAEAPIPGEISGLKELEANRGKPILKDVLDSINKEGRAFLEKMKKLKGSELDPEVIGKHPPDQNPPPLQRINTMSLTAQEGADFLKRVGFTTAEQERKSKITEHDDLRSDKYVPKDVYRQEEELMKNDPDVGPLIVEVEGEESDNQQEADLVGDVVPRDSGYVPMEEYEENPDDVDDEALVQDILKPQPMSLEERGAKGQAIKQQRDRERMERGESDEYTVSGRKKMTPQERGRLGQRVKQEHDRQRMLVRGEISEDQPTYQKYRKQPRQPEDDMPTKTPQEMGRKGQAVKQRRDRERMMEVGEIEDEEEDIYHVGYGESSQPKGRKPPQRMRQGEGKELTAHELGKRGQAAKQQRDRERMLERGEISEDEPTYYSQGRGKRPGQDEEEKPQNPSDMGRKGQAVKKRMAEDKIRQIEQEVEEEYGNEDQEMEDQDEGEEPGERLVRIARSSGVGQQRQQQQTGVSRTGAMGGGKAGQKMSPQERGRKGQAMKQQRDRERMLEQGEISEDEPTYYSQGRGGGVQPSKRRGGGGGGPRKQQPYEEEEEEEEEEYEEEPRKVSRQEAGRRGQAAKQQKDRQRMLERGEIEEDEPTYYSQGRGKPQAKGRQQQQYKKQPQYEEEEEEEDEEEEGHKMSPQERGRKGQAMKQKKDRERMLQRGEIEEDEPTYYAQGRGKAGGGGGGGGGYKKQAPQRRYKQEEEEEYEGEEEIIRKKPMTAEEMGRKGQAIKRQHDRQRMLARGEISEDEPTYETERKGGSRFRPAEEVYDEELGKPKKKMTPQEMGRRGQAAKQRADRERALAAGEISEDEPVYYTQGRKTPRGGGGGARKRRSVEAFGGEEEEEDEDYGASGRKMTPQERGRKGQAMKQKRDRERMLEQGEISEDEPTYYSQGRGKQGGGFKKQAPQRRYQEEEEEEEEEDDYEEVEQPRKKGATLYAGKGGASKTISGSFGDIMKQAERLKHQGFTIRVNVERDEDEAQGYRGGRG